MALSPSTSQNETSVDWQQEATEDRGEQESSSLHRSIRELRRQSRELTDQDISDVAREHEQTPSIPSPNTALQLALDSCDPWVAQPATPASDLLTGYCTARNNALRTTHASNLGQPPSTNGSSEPSGCDEGSYTNSSTERLASETDVLRNGILEELGALEAPDLSIRHPFGDLGYHSKQTFQVDQPPIAVLPTEDFAAQPWLEYYFERFHPRWPIIHQSTFNPATAIPDLLSMMSLIGAWEYGVTPSLEASERWSESLVLKLSNALVRIYLYIISLRLT